VFLFYVIASEAKGLLDNRRDSSPQKQERGSE